jgi:hypothetical protein
MPSQAPSPFASRSQLSTADLQLFRANSFRLIQFRKNASATPLESHTFKTKDLKPFRFTHFQKKGGGLVSLSNIQPHTSNLRSSLSPLISALTSKRAPKSFRCNTYEKHTQGEGGDALFASPDSIGREFTEFRISSFEFRRRSRGGAAFSIRGILLYSTGTIHPRFFYKSGGERAQCLQTASRSSLRDRN